MKFELWIVGTLVTVTLAHSSHDGPSMPKLVGGRQFLSDLKARNAFPEAFRDGTETLQKREANQNPNTLGERQVGGTSGTCGKGIGSCSAGICCSPAGYCGTGSDYCAGPDCQLAYGPGCDGNQVPSGASTASIARPLLGSQPYGGAGIYDCLTAGGTTTPFIFSSRYTDMPQILHLHSMMGHIAIPQTCSTNYSNTMLKRPSLSVGAIFNLKPASR